MSTIDHAHMDKYVDGKLVKEGKKDDGNDQRLNFSWWAVAEEERANAINATLKFLADHQGSRMANLICFTRLYGNSEAFSMIGNAFIRAATASPTSNGGRTSFNLCSSVIDTLRAKVAKNKVIPVFITNGGDWDIQLKAEQLSKFVEGCFYQTEMHQKGVVGFRDSGVWGTGIVHIDEQHDRIFVERAFPHEFLVDMVETLSTSPTQLHRVRVAERNVLLACYPDEEDREKIKAASPANFNELGSSGTCADLVVISDSIHLPSDPDADEEKTDGRRCICAGDQTIYDKPYTKTYYPYVFRHYNDRLMGFWGQGACERLQNLQVEVNRLMILDQRSRHMMGSFKVLVENGSKVVSQHLNNEVGTIIHYTGTPPQYVTPPAIDPSNEAKLDSLIQKGFRQEGVSELEASSVKPMGVDSGKAMRTIANIADDRQMFLLQGDESFYLECARQMIEKAKDIYKRKKSYKVMFPTTTFAQEIDWKDIKLDKDQYVMKAFPMSSLADDLAGRLSDIQEYMQAGLISPRAGRRLMRKPDLEMADKLADAAEDLLHKVFEEMLSGNGYRAPEPYFDLQLARELCLEYMNYADFHNCPDERMALLRQFLRQVDDLTGVNQPPPPPLPAAAVLPAGAGAPQAVPAPAPVSQLIPNVPGKVAA